MNFQINKDTLLNNLIVAQKALSNKTPNPALQGIKLEVLKDHLVITTSNSDIAIKLVVKDPSLSASVPRLICNGMHHLRKIRVTVFMPYLPFLRKVRVRFCTSCLTFGVSILKSILLITLS